MKGQQASWYLVALIVILVALPVLVSVCWPQPSPDQKPAPPATSVFVIPTAELRATATAIVSETVPTRTLTPRPTVTAYVGITVGIPTLPPPTATSTPEPTPEPTVTPVFRPNPEQRAPYQLPARR